jgi:hypothetical protein
MALARTAGVFEVDKAQTCRLLLHSSIRLLFNQSEPLVVHLAVNSAHDLIRNVAKHRGVELTLDFDKLVKPELIKEFWAAFKGTYNFIKHADSDPTGIENIAGLCRRNELQTLLNVVGAQEAFGFMTTHMLAFRAYAIIEFPQLMDLPVDIANAVEPFRRFFETDTRTDRLSALSDLLATLPAAVRERAEDHEINLYLERIRNE